MSSCARTFCLPKVFLSVTILWSWEPSDANLSLFSTLCKCLLSRVFIKAKQYDGAACCHKSLMHTWTLKCWYCEWFLYVYVLRVFYVLRAVDHFILAVWSVFMSEIKLFPILLCVIIILMFRTTKFNNPTSCKTWGVDPASKTNFRPLCIDRVL